MRSSPPSSRLRSTTPRVFALPDIIVGPQLVFYFMSFPQTIAACQLCACQSMGECSKGSPSALPKAQANVASRTSLPREMQGDHIWESAERLSLKSAEAEPCSTRQFCYPGILGNKMLHCEISVRLGAFREMKPCAF